MSPRPVIFISAVSRELKTARQLVANTLTFLGYEPEWQDIFGAGEGDLRAMLRRRIDASAGVVQLIGQSYGAEPATPDPDFGRVSYTQYEALYARQRGKKVWPLLLDEHFPTDPHDPEPADLRALQQAYRERTRTDVHLYQPIDDTRSLELHLHKLRGDLTQLRRRSKMWLTGIAAMLVLIAALTGWQMHEQRQEKMQIAEANQRVAAMAEEFAQLRQAVVAYPGAQAQAARELDGKGQASIEARAFEEVARQLKLDPKLLRERLPVIAAQLQHAPDATTYERASAASVAKDHTEAERLALAASAEALHATPTQTGPAIRAYELAGESAAKRLHYADALADYREAEKLTDSQRDPAEYARVQRALADTLLDLDKYREAEQLAAATLALVGEKLGPENPDTLATKHLWARCLNALDKVKEAEAAFRDVFDIRQRILGPEHPDTLRSRVALAGFKEGNGHAAEMEQEYRAVLAIRERLLGPEHPDTLSSRDDIASSLHYQGKYVEAETEARTLLSVEERVLGPEHPDTLGTRSGLVHSLTMQGRLTDAERESRATLALLARVLGPEDPEILLVRLNLGGVLLKQEKYADAEKELREVLAIRERVFGPDNSDALWTRNDLATTLGEQGRPKEAEEQQRLVIAGFERIYGPEHTNTLDGRGNLAYALALQERYPEAEKELREVLAIAARVFASTNLIYLNFRNNLAWILNRAGKFAEAEAEMRAALPLEERTLGADNINVWEACHHLGTALAGQNRFAEALPFAQRAATGRQSTMGLNHRDSKESQVLLERIKAALAK